MPALSSEQLKEHITSIPEELHKTLERQAKAQIEVLNFEMQIKKLQAEIAIENGQDQENIPEYDGFEDNLELLKLESAVERIKLQVTEAEDRAEMAFRKLAERTTEGQVKAAVGTDAKVMELRNKLLDAKDAAKERKITLQNERFKAREARVDAIYTIRENIPPANEKLLELQEKLTMAKSELILANIEVEVIHSKIDTYKMLVHLEDQR